MNVKDKIADDVKRYHVINEIDQLRDSLNNYLLALNDQLFKVGNMHFDFFGGVMNSHGYFDFSKDFLFTTPKMSGYESFYLMSSYIDIEFRLYAKSKKLMYWTCTVKSSEAKSRINDLIEMINKRVKELS